jgi:hypothetical protein
MTLIAVNFLQHKLSFLLTAVEDVRRKEYIKVKVSFNASWRLGRGIEISVYSVLILASDGALWSMLYPRQRPFALRRRQDLCQWKVWLSSGEENILCSTRDWHSACPARSQSLYRLRCQRVHGNINWFPYISSCTIFWILIPGIDDGPAHDI